MKQTKNQDFVFLGCYSPAPWVIVHGAWIKWTGTGVLIMIFRKLTDAQRQAVMVRDAMWQAWQGNRR